MSEEPSVGIDPGTANSCIGVFQRGKVEIITNDHGNRTTPSCVAYTDTQCLLGDSAIYQIDRNPKNTVIDFKRLIGRYFYDTKVQTDIQHWPFKVVNHEGKPKIQVEYKGETTTFYPEEISAMVLTKMKEIAETYLGKSVTNAVIAVPSNFNSSQRHSIKIAGITSGLNVTRIINESTAAAMGYALHKKTTGQENVLVFNLGASSLNVSIFAFDDKILEVKTNAGDDHLGGVDFNNRMVNHCMNEFKRRYKKDLTSSKRAVCRLRMACERAKCVLSSSNQANIDINCLFEDIDFYTTITRTCFEELNEDLFRSIMELVQKSLRDAEMDKAQIHDVVLVGGSSRIPKLERLLKDFFNGRELNKSLNLDEAVAYGAAVQAAILQGNRSKELEDLLLIDVTPFSLGIETADGLMAVLIKRNTSIPTKLSQSFNNYSNNQNVLSIKVYEGENALTKDNHFLGEFVLTDILPTSQGLPEIEVTFDIDANSNLTITVLKKSIGKVVKFNITNESFSAGDIERMTKKTKSYFFDHRSCVSAKEALKSYCFNVKSTLENNFRDVFYLMGKCNEVNVWLDDNESATKEDYEHKLKEFQAISNPLISKLNQKINRSEAAKKQ